MADVDVPDRAAIQMRLLRRSRLAGRASDLLWGAAGMALLIEFEPSFFGYTDSHRDSLTASSVLLVSLGVQALALHWKSKAENLPEDLSGSEYA